MIHVPPMTTILAFVLIMGRVAAIISTVPMLGAGFLPKKVIVLMSAALSLALLDVGGAAPVPGMDAIGLASAMAGEVGLGLLIGIMVKIFMGALSMGGQASGIQMGIGIANVMNPQTHSSISLVANFQYYLALLVFLALDFHHVIIRSLAMSLELAPAGSVRFDFAVLADLVFGFSSFMVIAIRLAAPIIATIFFCHVVLAIIAKAAPQLNAYFSVGLTSNVVVGLTAVVMSMPLWIRETALGADGLGQIIESIAMSVWR